MLIDDSRPELYIDNIECQNLSSDKEVFFIEDGHKYYHKDDIVNNKIIPFEDSKYKFRSPTGILAEFKEYFDTEFQAKKYVKKHELDITWEEQAALWKAKGDKASEEGTLLHGYAEAIWNKWPMDTPDNIKSKYVHIMHKELSANKILAKTELLVYSRILRIAGQVDLLMRNQDGSEYYILDYKFIKAPLERKSWFNPRTRKYKMMKGPFSRLYDSNYYHYSIQMEFYRYLMGNVGKKVTEKKLLVFTPEKYESIEGYDIKIWVSSKGILHARYKDYRGKLYDSSKDKKYLAGPFKVIEI